MFFHNAMDLLTHVCFHVPYSHGMQMYIHFVSVRNKQHGMSMYGWVPFTGVCIYLCEGLKPLDNLC